MFLIFKCFLIFIIIGWYMQLQVKSLNEEHAMDDTRFIKSNTMENDNNIGFNFQNEIFEDVTDDEVESNALPIDVNIGMEVSRNLRLAKKTHDYRVEGLLLL